MKKLLLLLLPLFALSAMGQSMLRNFATTNTAPTLTNIIASLATGGSGVTNDQVLPGTPSILQLADGDDNFFLSGTNFEGARAWYIDYLGVYHGPVAGLGTTFTNIAEMVASPLTNGVVHVLSYYGTNYTLAGALTNEFSGGDFYRSTLASGPTNLGTIFASAYGGFWNRIRPEGPNVWRLIWFGVTPQNTDDPTTRRDSYREITNAFSVSGDYSTLIFPNFGVFVTQDLITTNWNGRTLKGSGVSGAKLTYPLAASWIAYQGAGGTNSVILRCWNSRACLFDGIGFETSTPVYTSGAYYPTNNAQIGLDLDQFSSGGQISSDNTVRNCAFRSRGTNVFWQGYRISATSPNNCEGFSHENLYFHGGGNVDIVATGNAGSAILIGSSANARAHTFKKIQWIGAQYGLICSNGGFVFNNGLATFATFDFKLNSWVAPIEVNDFFSEGSIAGIWFSTGADAGGGITLPVFIKNYAFSHSSSVGTNALFQLYGSANLVFENVSPHLITASPTQQMFSVASGQSPRLVIANSNIGTNWMADNTLIGITNFAFAEGWNNDINQGKYFKFVRSTTTPWSVMILDSASPYTNHELMRITTSGLQLARTNSRVQIGMVPSLNSGATISAYGRDTDLGVTMALGDITLAKRLSLEQDGTTGGTVLYLNGTNSRLAGLYLKENSTGSEMRLLADNADSELRYAGGQFNVRAGIGSGGAIMSIYGLTGTITLSPTNPTTGLIINTEQTISTGRLDLAKSLLVRSNTTANWPPSPGPHGTFALVNSNGVGYILESALTSSWQTTNLIRTVASSGTGSNGISYASPNYPAVRTIDNEVVEILQTNGFSAFVFTNGQGLYLKDVAGSNVLAAVDTTVSIRAEDSLLLYGNDTELGVRLGLNTRDLVAIGGSVGIDYATFDAPVIGSFTYDHANIADGQFLIRSGNSILGSRITLKVDTTATGNVGAGTDNLISYTVPAQRLANNGEFLEFDVWGTCAANANPKQITVNYGGTTLIDGGAVVLNGVSWKAHGKIVRTGAATQTANCELTVGGTLLSAVNGTICLTTSPAETLSGTVVFKCTGTSTVSPNDNDIVQTGMVVKWYPSGN